MTKISQAQIGQMMVQAGATIEKLASRNVVLEQELARYQKQEEAEKIATDMEAKGLNRDLSFRDKVASIMKRDDLGPLAEAVSMQAPQLKLASVHEDAFAPASGGDGEWTGGQAEREFEANLSELEA